MQLQQQLQAHSVRFIGLGAGACKFCLSLFHAAFEIELPNAKSVPLPLLLPLQPHDSSNDPNSMHVPLVYLSSRLPLGVWHQAKPTKDVEVASLSYALFGWHFKLVIEPQIVIAVVVFVIVVLIVTRRTAVDQLQVHLAFCAFQARARMHFRRIKVNLATLQATWHVRNTCSADPPVQPAQPNPVRPALELIIQIQFQIWTYYANNLRCKAA